MNRLWFLLVGLLFVPFVSATLPGYSVSLQNDFVNQSSGLLVGGVVFENENCWRYGRLSFPDEFGINVPGVGSVVGVTSWGSNLSVVSPAELSWDLGSVFVVGNSLVFYRDVSDDCVEGGNGSGEVLFFNNFLVNPSEEGVYFVRGNVTLANDNLVHNLSDVLLVVRDYYSNYFLNYSVLNSYDVVSVNVSVVQVWNGSSLVNVSVGDFLFNLSNFVVLENNVSNVFSLFLNVTDNSVSNFNLSNFVSSLVNLSVFVNDSVFVNVNVSSYSLVNNTLFLNVSSPVDISSFENTTLVFFNNFSNPFNVTLDLGGVSSYGFFNLSQAFYNNFSFNNFVNVSEGFVNVSLVCGNTSVFLPEFPVSNDGFWIFIGLVVVGLCGVGVFIFSKIFVGKGGEVFHSSNAPEGFSPSPSPSNVDVVDDEAGEIDRLG